MRIVNEKHETINEADADLTRGELINAIAIKEDAEPIDNVNKWAWADEDYEEVLIYIPKANNTPYTLFKQMINNGRTFGMKKNVDEAYAVNELTEDQYSELTEMLEAAATV